MHDVQNEVDTRGVEIDAVGINGLRYPIVFDDGATRQAGVADIEMTVRLQADRRGTHMSRMVEVAHEHLQQFDPRRLPITLKTAANLLDTDAVAIMVAMPIAAAVRTPTGGAEAFQVSDIAVRGVLSDGAAEIETSVTAEVTSVCPCSKAISDYGAHNQRSRVTLKVNGVGDDPYPLPVLEAIDLIRSVGSAPVYPLVKRPDERVITMQAHDHPVFVEDMARDLALSCRERGLRVGIRVINLESIHSHDAIAEIHA